MKKVFLNYVDVILKFFGLQRIPDAVEVTETITYNGSEVTVIDENDLDTERLRRFNEILEICNKTYVPDGPKWDMDKRYPVHFEPEVIESHNSDPDRLSKPTLESLVDDEHKTSLVKLAKSDPLYINGPIRRKARAKLIGDNTKTKNRIKAKAEAMNLSPENSLFKDLRAEILRNVNEDSND